jgi:hypothetical protein
LQQAVGVVAYLKAEPPEYAKIILMTMTTESAIHTHFMTDFVRLL